MTPIFADPVSRGPHQLGLLSILALCGVLGISATAPARAGMVENIILSKCSEAMIADFRKSAQTPPPGMVNETCNCVLTGWQNKMGLDTAIKTCSAAATTKYGLGAAAPTGSK